MAKRFRLDDSSAREELVPAREVVVDGVEGFATASLCFDVAVRVRCFDEALRLVRTGGVDLNGADHSTGECRLNLAVRFDNVGLVREMLERGARIRDSYGALDLALANRNVEMVDLLIEHKADLNARDEKGRTLLHWHGQNDLWFYTEQLMRRGLDLDDERLGRGVSSPIFDMIQARDARSIEIFSRFPGGSVRAWNSCRCGVVYHALRECGEKRDDYFSSVRSLYEVMRYAVARNVTVRFTPCVQRVVCFAPLIVLDVLFRFRAFDLGPSVPFSDFVAAFDEFLLEAVTRRRLDIVRYVIEKAFGSLRIALNKVLSEARLSLLLVLLRVDSYLLARRQDWRQHLPADGNGDVSCAVDTHISKMRVLGEYENVPFVERERVIEFSCHTRELLSSLDRPLGGDGGGSCCSENTGCASRPTVRQVIGLSNEDRFLVYARTEGVIPDLARLDERFRLNFSSDLIAQRLYELKYAAKRHDLMRKVMEYNDRFGIFGSLLPDHYCVRTIFEFLSNAQLEEFLYRKFEWFDER